MYVFIELEMLYNADADPLKLSVCYKTVYSYVLDENYGDTKFDTATKEK